MLRKALFFVMVMLTVPNFASAYNYWSVTASSSPTGILSSAITAPTGAGFAQSGAVTNVTSSAVTSADFTVSTPAGYVLTAVTVDGVSKGNAGGVYTVQKGTKITHTISATYSTKKYTITTSKTGNGVIDATVQVPYNTAKAISMTAGSGYQIASVTKGDNSALDASVTFTGDQFSRVYTFPAVTADQTIKVNYIPVPVVTAKLDTTNQTVTLNTPFTVDGSISTSSVTPSFAWSVLPATGATVTGIAGGKATFVATAPGTYTVKLTLSAPGATDSVATVVLAAASQAVANSNTCTTCHAVKSPAATAAYNASVHATTETASCQGCHTAGTDTMAINPAPAVCANCHSGKVSEFTASIHWTSPTGHESDADFAAAGHGSVASCAAKCHFNQGATKGCAVCHSGALGVGAGNGVGGGSAGVISASNAHAINTNATVDNTCYACHSGGKHGWSPRAFEKSSHFTGDHAKLYYQFDVKKCLNCHDSHSTEATFGTGLDVDGGCATCHHQGPYGIFNADGSGKTPHGGGLPSVGGYVDGTQRTQYLSQGAVCADCHAHNNTINAGFAEGGHGHVSDVAMNAFTHYDWSGRTNNGTRQNGNCDRCHTAGGFVKLLDPTSEVATRLAPKAGIQNVLVCIGCHKALEGEGLENAPLRTDATPAGNPTPLTGGYFALFSSAAPTAAGTQGQVAANKTKIQIAFPGYKNSSICIPCHSGRSTAEVFVAVIDQAKLVNKNYTTIGTSYYQHAANMGQTFIGKGGYDFGTSLASVPATAHLSVKMGATDTQGPCVGCHHSTTDKTHSLEVNANSPTCLAAACHATAPNVEEAKASFDAGVAALDKLIREKFAPLQTVAGDLATERANVRFGRFGKAAGVAADDLTAKRAYGAWYNWQILATYDKAAYAHNPRYARQLLNDTIAYVANNGVITSGQTQRDIVVNAINAYSLTPEAAVEARAFYTAPGCAACHSAKVTAFSTSGAYHFDTKKYACSNCHTEQHMTTDAAQAPTCRCHGDNATNGAPTLTAMKAAGATCNTCHASNDVHTMKGADLTKKCTECHAIALSHVGGKTADNNGGVRAIMPEFAKRSHHITGAAPTDAQCAVCHLEGTADANGNTVVNSAYHMKDSKIYLRNVDGGAAFVWGGTEHSAMDNFCFACHDTDGAADINTIKAFLPAATSSNPFADTLTNGYDQVARAGVVDVKTQFTTTNASHHAVSGQRYKYRFSTAANAAAWAAKFGQPMPAASEIAVGNTDLDGNVITEAAFNNTNTAGNSGEEHGLDDRTLYEAGKFVATYIPLGDTANVADNSVLHCGDCHTVGQWAPGTSTNADGTATTAAIGAHGSANDYMLRNSLGTDALHSSQTYVCFNCHTANGGDTATLVETANDALWAELVADGEIAPTVVKPTWRAGWNALHPNVIAGQVRGYATAHAVSAFHAQCQADSSAQVGSAGTPAAPVLSRVWYTTGGGHKDRVLDFVPAAGATAAVPTAAAEGGNITGIACTNCHNSGMRQGWGGIHGGNVTYTDGLGRSQKSYRFMPGMGNYRYAPPGGWDGKDVTDAQLVTLPGAGVGAGKPMGGCYTNSASDANNGWSSCAHHGTSTAAIPAGIKAITGGPRTTLGGGTASNATAAEPTVREATAGNALVTRPLKY